MSNSLIGSKFKNKIRKLWALRMPCNSIYKEDVKALAKEYSLKIVDIKFIESYDKSLIATDTPKVTAFDDKPKPKPKPKVKKIEPEEDEA